MPVQPECLFSRAAREAIENIAGFDEPGLLVGAVISKRMAMVDP